MKNNYFIIILSILLLSLYSCNGGADDKKRGAIDSVRIEGIPEALKKHLSEQDSLSREMVAKIDTITSQLSISKKKIDDLQAEITRIQEPGQVLACIALAALLLSLIALTLAFVKTRNTLDKKKAKVFINEYLEECYDNPQTSIGKIKTIDAHVQGIESRLRNKYPDKQGTTANSSNNEFEKRLTDLERIVNLKNLRNGNSNNSSYDSPTPKEERQTKFESIKYAYSKINTSNYFVDLVDSKQETCVFSITFIGDDRGEFNIISLDKLKSRNGWQDVVEATGDCTMAEANSYDVIELGQCKKMEDNESTWEVTRKLKIKIRR